MTSSKHLSSRLPYTAVAHTRRQGEWPGKEERIHRDRKLKGGKIFTQKKREERKTKRSDSKEERKLRLWKRIAGQEAVKTESERSTDNSTVSFSRQQRKKKEKRKMCFRRQ